MRIDKYLWSVRYYKTRSIASEACKKGHISVNGQQAKSSREVFPTDKIVVRKDQINYTLTVLDVPDNRVGAKLVDMYRKDTTPAEAFDHLELLKLAKQHYRTKGQGRPTKKDRRDIDEYTEEDTDIEATAENTTLDLDIHNFTQISISQQAEEATDGLSEMERDLIDFNPVKRPSFNPFEDEDDD